MAKGELFRSLGSLDWLVENFTNHLAAAGNSGIVIAVAGGFIASQDADWQPHSRLGCYEFLPAWRNWQTR